MESKEKIISNTLLGVIEQRRPSRRSVRTVAGTQAQLPLVVEVEVNESCNRKCSYCPQSVLEQKGPLGFMSDEVMTRLLDQLADFNFNGRFSYHLYNEPLMRKDLERFIAQVRDRVPAATQVLYSNGDLLSEERYQSLVQAGIEYLIITRHDEDDFPERERQVVLRPSAMNMTNRGGAMFEIESALKLPCYGPHEIAVITSVGDVLLCYEDAHKHHVLGNIMDTPFLDIWASEEFAEYRRKLATQNRADASSLCQQCNNRAHIEQGQSWFAL